MEENERPVGYKWLVKEYGLSTFPLSHESHIGARTRSDATKPGVIQEVFPQKYWPGNGPFDHLVFALKYDDFNLDVLRQSFEQLGADRVRQYVESQPNGKYARQLGYLYEMLNEVTLDLSVAIGGAYVDLLDPEKYLVAATPVKNARWHVNDNLLGSMRFCPTVRKSPAIRALAGTDFTSQLHAFKDKVDPALFQRAVDYLYFKETRSSFEIERETPTADREQRFVRALHDAGKIPLEDMLAEATLTGLQNLIVEKRYAQSGFRDWQNDVGESMPGRPPIMALPTSAPVAGW